MTRPRIGVIGGLNMDIHLFGVSDGSRLPVEAERYAVEPGGKGTNQARAAARLGADVMLVGRVGDDEFGRDCIDAAAAEGVDVRSVMVTAGERTGFIAIELRGGRHRSLVFAPGANDALTWQDLERALPALAEMDTVIVQAEVPPPVLEPIVEWAQDNSVPLVLDPTPHERVTRPALAGASAITPNLAEATGLTGRTLDSPPAAVLAARDLVTAGAQHVLLKVRSHGTIIASPDRVVRVATQPVEPRNETGAGDAFIAAAAVRRALGDGWVEAARYANTAAALSVSADSLMLPTAADVAAAIDRTPSEVEELGL